MQDRARARRARDDLHVQRASAEGLPPRPSSTVQRLVDFENLIAPRSCPLKTAAGA